MHSGGSLAIFPVIPRVNYDQKWKLIWMAVDKNKGDAIGYILIKHVIIVGNLWFVYWTNWIPIWVVGGLHAAVAFVLELQQRAQAGGEDDGGCTSAHWLNCRRPMDWLITNHWLRRIAPATTEVAVVQIWGGGWYALDVRSRVWPGQCVCGNGPYRIERDFITMCWIAFDLIMIVRIAF